MATIPYEQERSSILDARKPNPQAVAALLEDMAAFEVEKRVAKEEPQQTAPILRTIPEREKLLRQYQELIAEAERVKARMESTLKLIGGGRDLDSIGS